MTMIEIGILGIAASVLAMQFQNSHKEYVVIVGLATSIFIFFSILLKIEVIVAAITKIQSAINVEAEYIETILKMLGITYVAELSSNICKESGYGSIASQIDLFAKVSILALSMPILLALLETIELFLT